MQNMIEFEQSEPDAEILAEFKLSKPKNRIQENNQPDTDQPQPQVPIIKKKVNKYIYKMSLIM